MSTVHRKEKLIKIATKWRGGRLLHGDMFLTISIKMYCSTLIACSTSNELAPPHPLFSVRYSDRGFN